MWSVGVIIYVLLAGYAPFHDRDQRKMFRAIKGGHFEFHDKYWNEVSGEAKVREIPSYAGWCADLNPSRQHFRACVCFVFVCFRFSAYVIWRAHRCGRQVAFFFSALTRTNQAGLPCPLHGITRVFQLVGGRAFMDWIVLNACLVLDAAHRNLQRPQQHLSGACFARAWCLGSFSGLCFGVPSPPPQDLITKLLTVDPEARITAGEACKHPWLFTARPQLSSNNLSAGLEQLKMFNAKRKFRAAVKSVSNRALPCARTGEQL